VKQLDGDIRAQRFGGAAAPVPNKSSTATAPAVTTETIAAPPGLSAAVNINITVSPDQVTLDITGGVTPPQSGVAMTTPIMTPGQVPLSDALVSSSSSSTLTPPLSPVGVPSEVKKEDSKRHSIADPSKAALDAAYVAQMTPTIFDAAQKNIFKLMQSDSFPRFIRSDHYKDLVKTVNQSKHAKEVLTEMGIM
jgi:hypothetical protein